MTEKPWQPSLYPIICDWPSVWPQLRPSPRIVDASLCVLKHLSTPQWYSIHQRFAKGKTCKCLKLRYFELTANPEPTIHVYNAVRYTTSSVYRSYRLYVRLYTTISCLFRKMKRPTKVETTTDVDKQYVGEVVFATILNTFPLTRRNNDTCWFFKYKAYCVQTQKG